jgi:DNA-binding CsgD family transcriptional regulator
MRAHFLGTMMNATQMTGMTNVGAASDVAAFTERCATGRLLAFALDPASNVVAVSPALSEALDGPLDSDRLARMMGGDDRNAEPLPVVSILHLSDGTRVVCLSEPRDARISRLLKRFAETYRLTPAERGALLDIAHGASAKESAQRLSLSPETVRARRKRIFRKMGVDGCGAVLARFLEDG